MKTTHILINIFLLYCFSSFAQNGGGKVEYSLEIFFQNNQNNTPDKTKEILNNISEASESVNLELIFNHNKSVFRHQKSILPENISPTFYAMAKMIGSKGIYFTDIVNNNQVLEINRGGKTYLINLEKKDIEWSLTKETKQIGKYKCYLAFTNEIIRNNNHKIIAWYAPNIAAPFGPLKYGKLPGLILELEYGNTLIFKAKKISFENINYSIEFPKKGTVISELEYSKISTQNLQSFKDDLKR
ncbi:GLPGLI family protein [Bizionia sediminis]|uniref:GLPGLI family protein n=1 Tax=Bizionia sediminis TaxID=1737064 RepID=A0ABW5KRI5_9FLAO